MIAKAIPEDSLRLLVSQNAVREARITKSEEKPGKWCLSVRLGGSVSRWHPVRSRREAVRTWSIEGAIKFATDSGFLEVTVEL